MVQGIVLRRLPLIAAVLTAAAALSGCTVIKEYAPQEKAIAQVKPEEYELARALLAAFVANDAKAFIALLPDEKRTNFNAETFAKTRKSIVDSVGEPVSFTYLSALELPSLTPQIWKVRFRRVNYRNGKEFTSELLFRVVTGMTGKNTPVITAFQFL